MRKQKLSIYVVALIVVFILLGEYVYLYYPQQSMPNGEPIAVITIDSAKYHNDCLHPCIRYDATTGNYYMAQSPYYGWDNKVENPMYYESDNYKIWKEGTLVADTPEKGYNSDPNIAIGTNGEIVYLWRECSTPLCDSLGCVNATVGGKMNNGYLSDKQVFITNKQSHIDIEQCPILIEHDSVYYIYAAWYEYEPIRRNLGVAIWKSVSLENPNFQLIDTIHFKSIYTCDKAVQIRLFGRTCFLPKPQYHDLWHFDLFEYKNKLYMVSVAEKGDNIMLSVTDDWKHFKTIRKPLINNHYSENYSGYRQYYYKPTAFVKEDTLHLFYTANAKEDSNRNQLFHTSVSIHAIIK